MQCPICKSYFERRFCRTCGNDSINPVGRDAPGVGHLVNAYEAKGFPREDYPAAVQAFDEAVKFTSSFPRVLAMITWFEYAMAICTVNNGGPLKNLSSSALEHFVRVLEQSQSVYNTLPEDSKQALSLDDYPNLFRSNFNEARRVQMQRGKNTAARSPTSSRASQAAKSGGCFVATAASGDPFAPEVIALSAFRDDVLLTTRIGRVFVHLYHAVSPAIAGVIARSSARRRFAMVVIVKPAVWLVDRCLPTCGYRE